MLAGRLSRAALAAASFMIATFAVAATAALPPGVTQGPSVEGVTQFQLANGLRVVLFPDATKPTTTVNVTYLVGSRFENYGETGMAHLLEHMLFKGTPSNPSVFTELGRRGMRFNGTTWYDRTNYFETFAANDANLDWALKMESERMTQSGFTKAELDSEMTVVRNEFERGENDPSRVLSQRVEAVAYDWHNYGHSTIGARSDIENVPFENLRAFYSRYYQPDNAVVVVAGKFDPDKTLELIARYFGAIPRPTRVLAREYTAEPVQDGERSVTIRRVGSQQLVQVLFRAPAGSSKDAAAMAALTSIMTTAPGGRLYKSLVEAKKASTVSGYFYTLHDPGMVNFEAEVALTDPIAAARDAMVATLTGVRDTPITDIELNRARAKFVKEFNDTINDPQRFGVRVSESIAQGDWRLMFINRDEWRSLKAADVTRVAGEYFKPANMVVGLFLPDAKPDRAPASQPVDVAALVANYKGDSAVAAGEAFDTSIANLESRTERLVLPNGMKVALLPRKTRGATVNVSLRMNLGDEKTLFGKDALASATAEMLTKGTQKRSRQDFDDALDGMLGKLHFSGDGQVVSAQGQTVRASLPDFLALMAEAVRSPRFDADEAGKMTREWLASVEQGRTDPEAIAAREIQRVNNPYPKGDLRYQPTIDEEVADIKSVTPGAMKAFHDQFYGASNAEIAVVGDFDASVVKKQLAELYGDWKAAAAYARIPRPMVPNKGQTISIETPDKSNATMRAALAVPMNDLSKDIAPLLVATRALGAGTDSRIFLRVRVKDGLAYGVGLVARPASIDLNTGMIGYAIFAPQNKARVQTGYGEEIDRALKDGFTDAEIASAKKALLESRVLPRADDAALAGSLTDQAWLGRTWKEAGALDADIAAVTPASAAAALRSYIKPGDIAYVYAGDFANAKK